MLINSNQNSLVDSDKNLQCPSFSKQTGPHDNIFQVPLQSKTRASEEGKLIDSSFRQPDTGRKKNEASHKIENDPKNFTVYYPNRGNSRINQVNQRNTETKNESKSVIRIMNTYIPKTTNALNIQAQPTLKMDNLSKANLSSTYQNDSKFDKWLPQFADNSKNNHSKKIIDSSNILLNHNSPFTENYPTPRQSNKEIGTQQMQQLVPNSNIISSINKNLEKNQISNNNFTLKNEFRATTSPAISNAKNYGNQNQKEIEAIKLKNTQGHCYIPVNSKLKLSKIEEVITTKDCPHNQIKISDNQNYVLNSFNTTSKGADDRKSNFQLHSKQDLNYVNASPIKLSNHYTIPDVHNTGSERNCSKIKIISEGNKLP